MTHLHYNNCWCGQDDLEVDTEVTTKLIHIRLKQMGRRTTTEVEGVYERKLDMKKLCKHIKKVLGCGGAVIDTHYKDVNKQKLDGNWSKYQSVPYETKILSFQGDHRNKIKTFLIAENIIDEEDIKVHGY